MDFLYIFPEFSPNYALSHDEVLAQLGPALVEQGPNPTIFREAMGHWRYIFHNMTEEQLLRLAKLVFHRG